MHYPALEADFRREYGLDLGEALWGRRWLGVRKLMSLVAGLPIGCALHRVQDPYGYGADWTHREELQALTVEVLDAFSRHYVEVHKKKGAPSPKPLRIPRPHEMRPKRKRNATGEELKAMMTGKGLPTVASKGGEG